MGAAAFFCFGVSSLGVDGEDGLVAVEVDGVACGLAEEEGITLGLFKNEVLPLGEGGGELVIAMDDEVDALGDFEVGFLAEGLNTGDALAGETFRDEGGGEIGLEGDDDVVLGGDDKAFAGLAADDDIGRGDLEGLALEVEVDGRGNGTTLVAHGIGVDLPPAETVSALPKAEISENFIKFGPVRRTGAVQRRELTLSNTGSADLIVRAVENEGHVAVSLAPGQRLAPGDSARIEVSLDPSKQEYGVLSEHVVVITNDPARPMRRLRVTAIIEQ